MERKRGTTVAVVAALIIAVVSLGIAFAAFSTTLTINGSATVTASNWDIHFERLSDTTPTTGTATITTAPTLSATTFSGLEANFKTPGDSVTYSWHVVNKGTFDATLATTPASLPKPTCTSTDTTSATNVCKNLTYTVTGYNNSLAHATGDDTITLTLTYNANTPAGELPTATVNVTLPQFSLVYTQSGGSQ